MGGGLVGGGLPLLTAQGLQASMVVVVVLVVVLFQKQPAKISTFEALSFSATTLSSLIEIVR